MSRGRRYNVEPIGRREKPKRGWHRQDIGLGGHEPVYVRNGYVAQPCDGVAHREPAHYDNCMSCAPMWGVVAVAVTECNRLEAILKVSAEEKA